MTFKVNQQKVPIGCMQILLGEWYFIRIWYDANHHYPDLAQKSKAGINATAACGRARPSPAYNYRGVAQRRARTCNCRRRHLSGMAELPQHVPRQGIINHGMPLPARKMPVRNKSSKMQARAAARMATGLAIEARKPVCGGLLRIPCRSGSREAFARCRLKTKHSVWTPLLLLAPSAVD